MKHTINQRLVRRAAVLLALILALTAVQFTAASAEGKTVNIAISSDPSFGFNAIGDSLMATNGLLREGLTRYGDGTPHIQRVRIIPQRG